MSDRRAAIRARLAAATPGPWARVKAIFAEYWTIGTIRQHVAKPSVNEADWDLIEHAPADLAYLLGEVERLEKEAAEGRPLVDFMLRWYPLLNDDGKHKLMGIMCDLWDAKGIGKEPALLDSSAE